MNEQEEPMVKLQAELKAGMYHGENKPGAPGLEISADPDRLWQLVTIKVKPGDDPAVVALAHEATKMRDYALYREIGTDIDLKPAIEELSIIAKLKKALTEKKAEYVLPIRGHLDDVNTAFLKIIMPLEEADRVTRDKVLAYRQAVAKRAAEAEEINRQAVEVARRQAEFSGTGEITVDLTPVLVPVPVARVQTDLGTAGVMKIRKWEVVDLSIVPLDYLMIDAGKVGKVVKAGIPSITGIRIWVEDSLRVTTK